MTETQKISELKRTEPIIEKQQLVAGVYSSRKLADTALIKIIRFQPELQMANASNILVVSKDNNGKGEVSSMDIGSNLEDNITNMAERVAVSLNKLAGKHIDTSTEIQVQATHLGYALKPGTVVIGLFVDPQYAARIEESIRKTDARVLTPDDLKRIGGGLSSVEFTNYLKEKAEAMQHSAPV